STKIKSYDKYNEAEEKRYALHWDPNKKIKYTLSRNFPKKYKFLVKKVIARWNEVLKDMKIAGNPLIELQENHPGISGEELGDLKHNFIVWIEDPIFKGPLGLGPSYADGLTGEIINADTYIFAGNIKQTVLHILEKRERMNFMQSQMKPDANNPDTTKSISELIHEGSYAPSFKKIFEEIKKPETLESALYHYKNLSDRCYYPALEETPAGGAPAEPWFLKKTEEELFQEIILNTLVHEMGHNLGLAHNFKGSLDKKHYISEKIQTSSAMDYLAIEDSEEGTPGPYDKAALAYAFSGDFDFHENYLFCSDQSVPIDPLCNHWDRGESAEKIAEYLVKKYHDGYAHRNFRNKKIHFKNTPEAEREYSKNLINYYFLPLREFLDYQIHVGTKSTTLTDEPLKEDEWKILLEDLEKAAAIGFDFFTQIILDKDRVYKDIIHPKFLGEDELLARGTWIDKLLAADALSTRNLGVDPWSALRTTYFDFPLYQDKLFEFFYTVATDISTPNDIVFTAIQRFMNKVPSGDSVVTAFASPSEDAAEFFNINELELNDEELQRLSLLNADEPHTFLIDHEKGKIFSAKKEAVLAYPTTPTYTLIEAYNKIFQKLTSLSLKEVKKAISLIQNLAEDLSNITEEHIMALNPLIHPAVIMITKESSPTRVILLLDEDEKANMIAKLNSIIEKANKELPAKCILSSLREYLNELNTVLPGISLYDNKEKLMEKLKEKEKELDPENPESNIISRLNIVKRSLNAYRQRIEMIHYLYN
ncbi:MAG: zinc-dependent metalloprotease, partial [Deltaproteobacteria bacterium]